MILSVGEPPTARFSDETSDNSEISSQSRVTVEIVKSWPKTVLLTPLDRRLETLPTGKKQDPSELGPLPNWQNKTPPNWEPSGLAKTGPLLIVKRVIRDPLANDLRAFYLKLTGWRGFFLASNSSEWKLCCLFNIFS